MARPEHQVISAPIRVSPLGIKSIYLAGPTTRVDDGDWREQLTALLVHLPITIYNPYREDYEGIWAEDIEFLPYYEQVDWELDMQDKADYVVIYFHPATKAPVSLLELGLSARVPGKAIVVCPEEFWKRGNVQMVCERYGVEMAEDLEGIKQAIEKRLELAAAASTTSPGDPPEQAKQLE